MILKKYTFKSEQQGPNVLFLGAVHGNEPAGAKAIYMVLEKFASRALTPLKGTVSFIPVCNPGAFEQDVRQIDENLNRIIKKYDNPQTYEQQIANELVDHIKEADIIIDLHSTFCQLGEPFIFSDYPNETADKIASVQNIKYIIKGWPEIYAGSSSIQDYSTGACAQTYGKTCLTVECGHHYAQSTVQTAYYTIMSTLLCLNILDGYPSSPIKQEYIQMKSIFIKAKEGKLAKNFNHLDKVRAGEILAIYDDGTNETCPEDAYILLPKANAPINSEWFYLGCLAKDR